jgi:predicted phosphodiesterase
MYTKTKLLLLTILFLYPASGQDLRFAWLTDIHVGFDKSDSVILKEIDQINKSENVGFVVVTGDVSEIGKWEELERAEKLLKNLTKPVFVIPGNHDVKWSNLGGLEFVQIFGDNRFRYDTLNYSFIGLNSGIVLRGGGGHITPEDLAWLEENLNRIPKNNEVYFFLHHPLNDDVDNWYKVTKLLKKKNVKAIFVGHGHINKEMEFDKIPAVMGLGSTSKTKMYGFNLVDLSSDKLKISSIASEKTDSSFIDTTFSWYNKEKIAKIDTTSKDSSDFIDYKDIKILAQFDLKKTLVTSPVPHKDGFLIACLEGMLYNFDLNGKLIWSLDLDSRLVSRPVIIDNLVFAGTVGGDLFQIELKTGASLQTMGINESITSQLTSFPVFFRDKQTTAILIGTASGTLYAYEAKELTPIWQNKEAKNRIESLPLVLSDRVVFSAWDGMTYCIDLRTGKLNWKWSENVNFYFSTASCMPVANEDFIYFVSPDKSVSSVDLLLGKTQWSTKEFNAWESLGLSNDGKTLYVKSIENEFHVINAITGKKIKSIKTKWGLDTNPIQIRELEGTVLFGLKNGMFVKYLKDKFVNSFYLGQARPLTIEKIGKNYIAGNMDGKFLLFSLKK